MAEWLADLFIELVNRSIAASWLVLAVLVLRLCEIHYIGSFYFRNII